MSDTQISDIEDCISWFILNHVRTTNALEEGDYLVYITRAPEAVHITEAYEVVINNAVTTKKWLPSLTHSRDTTLADLLTDENKSFGYMPIAPMKKETEGESEYDFTAINLQFIRELTLYFNRRAVPFVLDKYDPVTLRIDIGNPGAGGNYAAIKLCLRTVFNQPCMKLGEAVERAFNLYKPLENALKLGPTVALENLASSPVPERHDSNYNTTVSG